MLHKNDIGVVVRGVLAKGLLAQKDLSNYLNYSTQDIELLRNKMDLFSIEKMTNPQLALKWVLSNKSVTTVAVGIRTKEQLADALGVFETQELTEKEILEFSNTLKPNIYSAHR